LTKKCPYCGTTYEEIIQTGFVGCEHCYNTIPLLQETLKGLYGQKKHKGRGKYGSIR